MWKPPFEDRSIKLNQTSLIVACPSAGFSEFKDRTKRVVLTAEEFRTGVQLPPAPPKHNPKQTLQNLKALENINLKGFFIS
ncbi:hypothetical protein SA2876_06825 [Aggregatibacter actinomycetemcomitans serotype e str. SA2876]|nr:hypothetical protein SA2876_06825 [Aggregatibacter actinomycetemcomitans serotype e str. SA2876]